METDFAKPDREVREEQPSNGGSTKAATLTSLFDGAAKDAPAVIIPEGNERSVTYAQLYEDVMYFQREFAGQCTPSVS